MPDRIYIAITPTKFDDEPDLQPALTAADRPNETDVGKRPSRRGLSIAAAATAMVLAAGIVIIVGNKEGKAVASAQTENCADVALDPEYIAEANPSVPESDTSPQCQPGEPDTNPKRQRRQPSDDDTDPKHERGEATEATASAEITARLSPPARHDLARPTAPPDGTWPADAPPPAIAPFDQQQARKHQQAWADYLKLPLEYANSVGMKFVLIPPGEFNMGSTPEEIEQALKEAGEYKHWQQHIRSEAPTHNVVLTRPFYLAVHEVTQKEYEAVMGKNPSYFAKTGPDPQLAEQTAKFDTANRPVEGVSWNDAAEFCAMLSKQEELTPFYFRAGETVTPLKGTGYRLPTEAEWEFACRAGTTTKFWNGDEAPAGWFANNSGGRTHEVEELAGNSFGLFDVHGNVWEWVQDGWQPTYYERLAMPAIDPACPFSAGFQRVLRGGHWYDFPSNCRSSARRAHAPSHRSRYIGYRVVLVAVVSGESR